MLALQAPISSKDNGLFKSVRKLAESGRERRKAGLILLDGLHLVDAWHTSGSVLQKIVLSATGAKNEENLVWLNTHSDVSYCIFSDNLYKEIENLESANGLFAVVEAPRQKEEPSLNADSVLFDGVQDPGNVGTLLRTAAAAGFRQILLTSDCAQAWSPKTLRSGMGAHFSLEIHEAVDAVAFLEAFQGRVAITQLEGSTSLYDADLHSPMVWVFGSEGSGVRPAVAACSSVRVRIPMPGIIESLNVAAAAAVCLFETVRQRTVNQV